MYSTTKHTTQYLISFCILLLLGALAVYTLTLTQPAHTHAAAVPITANGYGTAHGCPSNSVGSQTARASTVIVTPQQANSTILAHPGNLIEFHFPFGQRWSGPTTSQGNLRLLPPAGYANSTGQVCVWRFIATRQGTTRLNFTGGPLCQPGQVCPFFVMLLPFTIKVQ